MLRFGVIGLGRIGGGLALQALRKGIEVHGCDLAEPSAELTDAGLVYSRHLEDLVSGMTGRRILFLYIHAGPAIDEMLDRLLPLLNPGDIVIDGGNSYWGDSIRRHARMAEKGIHFVDLGTSGGVTGALNGACFMVGGDSEAVDQVEPILKTLCIEGGYTRCAGPGSGHFVKLVHNGIEFGMLQAIGEGIDLLEKFHQDLPVGDVLSCWRNGSVIRSWLVDLMHEQYVQKDGLESVPGYIEDTGEVNWLVADALNMEVPIPVITQSVVQLFTSRDDKRDWARAIAMMRNGFGGHPFGPKEELQVERKISRVGDYFRPGELDGNGSGAHS